MSTPIPAAQPSSQVREYMRSIGAVGGRAGVGACKVRSYKACARAAKAKWAKYYAEKLAAAAMGGEKNLPVSENQ